MRMRPSDKNGERWCTGGRHFANLAEFYHTRKKGVVQHSSSCKLHHRESSVEYKRNGKTQRISPPTKLPITSVYLGGMDGAEPCCGVCHSLLVFIDRSETQMRFRCNSCRCTRYIMRR